MAKIRRTFRVGLGGERFTVETTALDLVKAERDGQGPVAQGLRTAHWAMIRNRLPVPMKFDDFCLDLDSFDDLTVDDDPDEAGADDMDPTQSAESAP